MDIKRVIKSKPKKHNVEIVARLFTPWGENIDVDHVLTEHPRPQFSRDKYLILNGVWDYAIVLRHHGESCWMNADPPSTFDGSILVPFSPEALLSGVGKRIYPDNLLWYRRFFDKPALKPSERCILHFEAVDYCCACYINGVGVGTHVGGYLPFCFDITDQLKETENELMLCCWDPNDQGVQLRGKQKIEMSDMWYTAQSGIWQPVWMEVVPEAYMIDAEITPDVKKGCVELNLSVHGEAPFEAVLKETCGTEVSRASLGIVEGTGKISVCLPAKNPHLWCPEDPYLYNLELSYGDDRVHSYCAFRTLGLVEDSAGHTRFCLNGKPFFLKGVLDQGYWSDGLMTPPDDKALIFDIQSMKDLGFNMLRKHIKVENSRFYYHCDRLGMLVWQDMVTGGATYDPNRVSYFPTLFRWSWTRFRDDLSHNMVKLGAGNPLYRREWLDTCLSTIAYLKNHPCIVTWVLFNEAWGQFNAQRAEALAREADPTRPIDAVSGWYDQGGGDYKSVHNYFRNLEVWPDTDHAVFGAVREKPIKRAFVISEFGGISYMVQGHTPVERTYGYENFDHIEDWREWVRANLDEADNLEAKGLAGYVFTQLSDIEEETNGILSYDRHVNKFSYLEPADMVETPLEELEDKVEKEAEEVEELI